LVKAGALMKTHLAHLPATHQSSKEVATALAGLVKGMSQLFLGLQADSLHVELVFTQVDKQK